MPDYALGDAPPRIRPDVGSGAWCSDPQTAKMLAYKRGIEFAMDAGATRLSIGPYATQHMRHYMDNTGTDLKLDLVTLVNRSAQLRGQLDAEIAQAKSFIESLGPGRHMVRSTRLAQGYFRQRDDSDLFFAIGGYSYWGMGAVNVTEDDEGGLTATLDFTFSFFDRYNWDGGKKVQIAGVTVTDAFMQKFHRECYAREYDVRGELKRREVWHFKAKPADPFAKLR